MISSGQPHNRLSKLLARWSKLEFSLCQESGAHRGCYYVGDHHDYGLVNPYDLKEDNGFKHIVNAIILGLNNRNWNWVLSRTRENSLTVYYAKIYCNDSRCFVVQSRELEKALLISYLDALQSEIKDG